MSTRLFHLLVVLDSLVYVILTLGAGYPAETISSAAYRAELQGTWFRWARPVIDTLLAWLEPNHCQGSYYYAYNKRNLPLDMR